MASWGHLDDELQRWQGMGLRPGLWWRDDDAVEPTAALDRLIVLAERFAAPLHLAVIPSGAQATLSTRLRAARDVYALQHGFAHINHEPQGGGASEFGATRDLAAQEADLRAGWARLEALKIPRLLPGFVPPWNRLSEAARHRLPALGYKLLAAFAGPTGTAPVPGLTQIDSHLDPLRWKSGARFRGEAATLGLLVDHLADRRMGRVSRDLPTGLLTHHLQTDDATWAFLEQLLTRLDGRCVWVRLDDLLKSELQRYG